MQINEYVDAMQYMQRRCKNAMHIVYRATQMSKR